MNVPKAASTTAGRAIQKTAKATRGNMPARIANKHMECSLPHPTGRRLRHVPRG